MKMFKENHSYCGLVTGLTRIIKLSIKLPAGIEHLLAELAARSGCTKAFYAREAILEHLDEMEVKYPAIDRMEKVGKRWTLNELEKGIDLEGWV